VRYAKVPETIVVYDDRDKTSAPLSLYQYAGIVWLDDIKWSYPRANLASLVKVIAELKKPPGETMSFEDADYELLKRVILQPQLTQSGEPVYGIRPSLMIQVSSYEKTILEATSSGL